MRQKKTTIIDIAEACGLSKTAVAYILNGNEGHKTAPERVALVHETAKRLGYRVNTAAKTLSSGKTRMAAVLMPLGGSQFYDGMALAQQESLRKAGYDAVMVFWPYQIPLEEVPAYIMPALKNCQVDGIISWYDGPELRDFGVPVVYFEEGSARDDRVFLDHKCGFETLFDYLKKQGRRKLGFAMRPATMDMRIIPENDFEIRREWILPLGREYMPPRDTPSRIRAWKEPPEAMIFFADMTAFYMLPMLRAEGYRIPEDIAAVSFDNMPECAVIQPPLTSFDRKTGLAAETLTELLVRRIENPELPAETRLIPPELIVRDSCPPLKQHRRKK